jgi:hypothetical protein
MSARLQGFGLPRPASCGRVQAAPQQGQQQPASRLGRPCRATRPAACARACARLFCSRFLACLATQPAPPPRGRPPALPCAGNGRHGRHPVGTQRRLLWRSGGRPCRGLAAMCVMDGVSCPGGVPPAQCSSSSRAGVPGAALPPPHAGPGGTQFHSCCRPHTAGAGMHPHQQHLSPAAELQTSTRVCSQACAFLLSATLVCKALLLARGASRRVIRQTGRVICGVVR